MEQEKKFDLEDRLIDFGCRIIDIVESLPNSKAAVYIANQMIRCGLAPSLLYGEVQAAESREDFIHKMKIALKELKETRVCLKYIVRKEMIKPVSKMNLVVKEIEELIAIISKSIETAKKHKNSKK